MLILGVAIDAESNGENRGYLEIKLNFCSNRLNAIRFSATRAHSSVDDSIVAYLIN